MSPPYDSVFDRLKELHLLKSMSLRFPGRKEMAKQLALGLAGEISTAEDGWLLDLFSSGQCLAARQKLAARRTGRHSTYLQAVCDLLLDDFRSVRRTLEGDRGEFGSALLSLSSILEGDEESAAVLARTTGSGNLQALVDLRAFLRLESGGQPSPVVQAELAMRQGDHQAALAHLTRADGGLAPGYLHLLRARAAFEPARQALDAGGPEALEHGRVSMQAAANELEKAPLDSAPPLARKRTGITASAVLALLGDLTEALTQAHAALSLDDFDPEALYNKAVICTLSGRLEEAGGALRRISGSLSSPAAVLMAEIHRRSGNQASARALLDRLPLFTTRPYDFFSIDALIEVSSGPEDKGKSESIEEFLSTDAGEQPESLWLRARRCSFAEEACQLLQEARNRAEGGLSGWLSWELARCLTACGRHLTACDEYARAVSGKVDSPVAREHVMSLYNAELMSGAHSRARQLRGLAGGHPIAGVTEIEIDCLVQAGHLEDARDLLRLLVEQHPSVHNRAALDKLLAVLGKNDRA